MDNNDMLRLDKQLCFSAYAVSRAITKIYRPVLDELGITYPQYLVMLVLWEVDSISLKELGSKLYLDSGTLTPLLKRLEAMGFLHRERSSEDERILLVTLTNEGKALKNKAEKVPSEILQAINTDIEELFELKKKLDNLLEKLTDKDALE